MRWHRPRIPRHYRWNRPSRLASERMRLMFGDDPRPARAAAPFEPAEQIESLDDLCDPPTRGAARTRFEPSRRRFIPPPVTGVSVERRISFHAGLSPGGTAAIAALSASLFLLACAYAAFSGYMHSYNDAFAYLGILGAVGSLLAAGIGVCLAADSFRQRYSSRLLSVCAIALAAMYGVLLFLAATGR